MRTHLECVACLAKQAVEIARSNIDPKDQEGFVRDVLGRLAGFDYNDSPPMMAKQMYDMLRSMEGVDDPYSEIKASYNAMCMDYYSSLSERIRASRDPLDTAMRIAVAGNIIDFGLGTRHSIDIDGTIDESIDAEFAIDHSRILRDRIDAAQNILYLGDNAGEIVFDKIFIQNIGPEKVVFAVRDVPVINDVTMYDARQVGMDKLCRVISSGSRAPGTPLEGCSSQFRDLFGSADLVISKGQGNFETLSDAPRDVFFLFMVKCPVIAEHSGVPVGSFVAMNREP
ncbi:MAG: ARMT1-like domain-containing protein [Thermodesulfobacteriota bacterium]|nr:ARMT1-like domain-containing protein [Thermodesulfobacteriota bacterium]